MNDSVSSDKLKRLLLLVAAGGSLKDCWMEAGFSSLEQAASSLRAVAEALGTGGYRSSPAPAGSVAAESAGAGGSGTDNLVIYVDGASRGNPGPAAAAAVAFLPSGERVASSVRFIGNSTNNKAEYEAVLEGLHLARELRASRVALRLDSELVVRQLKGEYRIKNAGLRVLAESVFREAAGFLRCVYERIPRKENSEADRLANERLDGEAAAGGHSV